MKRRPSKPPTSFASGASLFRPFVIPTVARGQARLRVTLTAAHSPADVKVLRSRRCRIWKSKCKSALQMHPLAKLDRQFVWHPFTQMRDWLRREPIVIVEGEGAMLRDAKGREFLDANSSIWTNLHGHNHPKINAAIRRQLKKIAHSSALGLANEPASLLAEKLVGAANPFLGTATRRPSLNKVFFSDNGSTALGGRAQAGLRILPGASAAEWWGERPREPESQSFFRSKARITATRWARFRSATLICFTRPTAGCCSRVTR